MKLFPGIAILCAAALAAGCSSVVNSHRQKEPMLTAYMDGDNDGVTDVLKENLKDPNWYNTSVIGTGDELIWRLEAGSFSFHIGKYQSCIEQLEAAEELIADYDDRAKISMRDVGAEAGAALTNMNALPYRGLCRDRMALSIYKSLAYLGVGREDAFRAQLKRLRNEQKKVQDDYQEFFDEEKELMAAARAQNPEAARTADTRGAVSVFSANGRNPQFVATMDKMREVAHRGYGDFLNPAAIYLSGLGSLRDGLFDNARIDFQRLYEAMPANPMTRKYYVTALTLAGREIPEELADTAPFDFPVDHDCVYVITANGRGGALQQVAVYYPIMTAWPVCEFYPADFNRMQATAGGVTRDGFLLADMDGILAQEFDQRLPGIIARIALSTAIKEAAYYSGLALAANSDMDDGVKALVLLGIVLGGTGYRAAMNTADTRSWEMLPKEFLLTQFPMPSDREVTVSLSGASRVSRRLRIPEGCPSAIIFVSAPSARNVTIHVLPMMSK